MSKARVAAPRILLPQSRIVVFDGERVCRGVFKADDIAKAERLADKLQRPEIMWSHTSIIPKVGATLRAIQERA